MNILVQIVIFASLIYGNFAATIELNATNAVAETFEITQSEQGTQAVEFLKHYIADRSNPVDLENRIAYGETGLHYITTVKLSDLGHEMPFMMKNGEPTLEHLQLNKTFLKLGDSDACPVPGLVYHAMNTPYDPILGDKLKTAISRLLRLSTNDKIRDGLPNLAKKQATTQVAVSIVKGTYFGQDVGVFLMVGAYIY